jgi:rhamnosyl/mannosyltransferase
MDYLWNNPIVAKKMGESAGARYCDLFTADIMAESYFNLYSDLLDK